MYVTRWSMCKSSCSAVFVATNFIVGHCTASAIGLGIAVDADARSRPVGSVRTVSEPVESPVSFGLGPGLCP